MKDYSSPGMYVKLKYNASFLVYEYIYLDRLFQLCYRHAIRKSLFHLLHILLHYVRIATLYSL